MKTAIRLGFPAFSLLLVFAATASGQSSPEALARYYNSRIGAINDKIDDLRSQLNNPDLNMQQAARIVDQQSAIRRQADKLWKSTQGGVDDAYDQMRGAINKYNVDNRRLEFQSAIVSSQVDMLNNVARNPNKDDFDQNRDQMARDWEARYGSRLKPFGEDFAQRKDELFARIKTSTALT